MIYALYTSLTDNTIMPKGKINSPLQINADNGDDMKSLNNLRQVREERLMSKSELAQLAGVSAATVNRIELGELCRLETKRKIILALGLTLPDKHLIFPNG